MLKRQHVYLTMGGEASSTGIQNIRKLVKTIVHARDPLFGGQGKEETMGLPS